MMLEIISTKNYEIFKTLTGNRPLDKYHLKKLKKSIEASNQIAVHPIIVNENYEVIDGQHRLEVCKQLGIEICYILSNSIPDNHVILANVNQKPWEVENYILYFTTREKVEDYIDIKQMLIASKLKPKALLSLILGSIGKDVLEFLKTGKFRLPKNKEYEKHFYSYLDFIAYVSDKRINPMSMFTNHYFTKSFRWLCMTSGFEFSNLIKKLDLRWFDLKPQRSAEDWYKLLISIYNFKNHSKIEEEYGKI